MQNVQLVYWLHKRLIQALYCRYQYICGSNCGFDLLVIYNLFITIYFTQLSVS